MNKTEMAEKLAEKAGISKAKAAEIIEHIFSTKDGEGIIAVELDAGNKVNITGFGSFSIKSRSARQGRNPATGATIMIPAKKHSHFSASKGLKDRVANGQDRVRRQGPRERCPECGEDKQHATGCTQTSS